MTTTDSIVSRNIKRLRDDLGLSQEALAAEAGIAKYTLHKIEHGARAHGSTLRRIAEALGTSIKDLRYEGPTQEQADIKLASLREQNALLRQALDERRDREALELADELSRMLDDPGSA